MFNLSDLPAAQRYIVALSGGLDSTVLLHHLVMLAKNDALSLSAIHINHGLSSHADAWAMHCQALCASLNIPYQCLKVDARPEAGESPEAAAREARYNAFAELMQPDDCLLTAHHQRDQAETLLMRLLRGSGLGGLGAMAKTRQLSVGLLHRPLLAVAHARLVEYAHQQQLQWVEDDSNQLLIADRNFIRRQILPHLQQRWPGAIATLARSAFLLREADELLQAYVKSDFMQAYDAESGTLKTAHLLAWPRGRQNAVIRIWLSELQWPLPSAKKLQHIINDVLLSSADAQAIVAWDGVEVRRYQDALYALPAQREFDARQRFTWDTQQALNLPDTLGTLIAHVAGTKAVLNPLEVRFRQGGEVIQLPKREGRHCLKKLFQAWRIPPWDRERIPLIYYQNQLIAVADYAVAAGFELSIQWQRRKP